MAYRYTPLRRTITLMLAAATGFGGLSALPAQAVSQTKPAVSVRTFKPAATAGRASLLTESNAVSAAPDAEWGGVETLNIPQTKSKAELDHEAAVQKAAQEAEEARQRAERASREEASRNATRQAISTTVTPAEASPAAQELVQYALQYLGSPYRYGGTTPAGWDCSGYTSYVYGHFGIRLSHQSEAQRGVGQRVSKADAQPGDLMWKPGHVGIYLGNGMMVHASTPSTGTIVSSTSYASFEYYRVL